MPVQEFLIGQLLPSMADRDRGMLPLDSTLFSKVESTVIKNTI